MILMSQKMFIILPINLHHKILAFLKPYSDLCPSSDTEQYSDDIYIMKGSKLQTAIHVLHTYPGSHAKGPT